MYIILINEDNTMSATQKQRIIQRSKLVDDLWFLVNPIYNGHDLTNATVLLEYVKPVSKEYKTETLVLSEERYKDYLKYILPVDTEFTKEAGILEVQLSFLYLDVDSDGAPVQRVRKISPAIKVKVFPISAWSDFIPDSALSAIDQRIIKQDAQIKMMADLVDNMSMNMVDDIKYNETEETLQLQSGGYGIGSKVSVRDMIDDGIPVVDLDSDTGEVVLPEDKCDCGCEDNVVEFGYSEIIKDPISSEDENNVVEF